MTTVPEIAVSIFIPLMFAMWAAVLLRVGARRWVFLTALVFALLTAVAGVLVRCVP